MIVKKYFLLDHSQDHRFTPKLNKIVNITKNINDADAILVMGGDGSMVRAIQDHQSLNKPFIGINAGTRGFLMNNADLASTIYERLDEVEYETMWMLEGVGKTLEGSHTVYGFNDIWIFRASNQTLRMEISINGTKQSSILIGDGLLFSTPQGSTGYNLALRGKAIPTGVPVLQITPMACVVNKAPLGSVILSDATVVEVEFAQLNKRPGALFYDGFEVTSSPVQRLTIRKSNRSVRLGFIKEYSFHTKVLAWQFQSL